MRRSISLITILFLVGCAKVLAVRNIPQVTVGDASFFRTIEAHTGAPIVAGNRIEVLLNGDQTFPRMLRDIKSAKATITFAQYLYEDGSIAHELAQAFAERCRAGVKANILLDRHGKMMPSASICRKYSTLQPASLIVRMISAGTLPDPWRSKRMFALTPARQRSANAWASSCAIEPSS